MKSNVGQGQQTSDHVEHLWKIFNDYRSKSKLKVVEVCFVLITEEGILSVLDVHYYPLAIIGTNQSDRLKSTFNPNLNPGDRTVSLF